MSVISWVQKKIFGSSEIKGCYAKEKRPLKAWSYCNYCKGYCNKPNGECPYGDLKEKTEESK